MEKVNLDWANLSFDYHKTSKRYVANFKDGSWQKGYLSEDDTVVINEAAGVLQYSQQVFEGLKAYTTCDGSIVTFRPDMNAKRMIDSALRLEIPPYSEEDFLNAIDEVVKANREWVPPYGSGASLYIRPYIFASSPVIGVKPAKEYQFRIFVTPVGPYFKGGMKPLTLCISDYDRAAPKGTGHTKAGLNYAMSLRAYVEAHNNGYDENLYLDAKTKTFIEETGGANIIFITKDKEVVTPKSDTILPSITRKSIMYVAENYLGLKATEREIRLDEIDEFMECGLCGTAAVISPVGKIVTKDKEIVFPRGTKEMGEVSKKLYETLTGIQQGTTEAPEGWIRKIL